jgi:hypothetical protein
MESLIEMRAEQLGVYHVDDGAEAVYRDPE